MNWKEHKINSKFSIEFIEKSDTDKTPYVQIEVFAMSLYGLLHSGASLSCLSDNAAKQFLSKNIPYKNVHNFVQATGGQLLR